MYHLGANTLHVSRICEFMFECMYVINVEYLSACMLVCLWTRVFIVDAWLQVGVCWYVCERVCSL